MFHCPAGPETKLALLQRYHAQPLYLLVEANRAHLSTWLPWVDQCDSIGHTLTYIERGLEQFAAGDGFQTGIWHRGVLVGVVATHVINWTHRNVSLGYWISEDAQGQGIVTFACQAVIDHLFDTLRLHRVEIRCATENHRSRAIPVRLGFEEEGTLRGIEKVGPRYLDLIVYGMLRATWRNLSKDRAIDVSP